MASRRERAADGDVRLHVARVPRVTSAIFNGASAGRIRSFPENQRARRRPHRCCRSARGRCADRERLSPLGGGGRRPGDLRVDVGALRDGDSTSRTICASRTRRSRASTARSCSRAPSARSAISAAATGPDSTACGSSTRSSARAHDQASDRHAPVRRVGQTSACRCPPLRSFHGVVAQSVADARRVRAPRARRARRRDRAARGRDGHRQREVADGDPPRERARGRAVHRRRLRRDPGRTCSRASSSATRSGSFTGRGRAARRRVRGGRGRHHLPRRDRRAPGSSSSRSCCASSRAARSARREQQHAQRRRADRRGDQPAIGGR